VHNNEKLSVVIPVFNESGLISELIKRVKENIEKISNNYEILIVDDGSTDETWSKIAEESLSNNKLKSLKFSRNFGHHYAITAGLHLSTGDWAIVMDGDLQDKPENIPKLYRKAQEGFDVVFISRQNRPEKLYYKLMQKLFYQILNILSGIKFDSSQANFSIINRKVIDAFKLFPENSRFYGATIRWLGFKRTQIFADHGERYSGRPSYTFRKRIKLAADIIVSFSERPLKFAIGMGFIVSTISTILTFLMLYGIVSKEINISGLFLVLSSITFFSGLILIILGVLGIYLGRIFQQVKERPLYVISDTLNM
jgi:glycosyltransferase involved in cell wall biosynthesis